MTPDDLTATKNEVTFKYHNTKEEGGNTPISNGTINEISKDIKRKRNFLDCAVIKSNTIHRENLIFRILAHVEVLSVSNYLKIL